MNQIFRYIGYPKQAFHQKLNRQLHQQEYHALLLPLIEELREEHPGVSSRNLYLILQPEKMGRDKFEALCFENGFKLSRPKAYKRTTDSSGVIRFPNLIQGREFSNINQVWASDITYYEIGGKYYYLTFILDLFSRSIVGYAVSKRLLTVQTTLPALQMAIKNRNPPPGLIFHSDGGGQYYCSEFLKLTEANKISNSMCDIVFENAHAERVNGTIKNQYLKGYDPKGYEALEQMTARAIFNYNNIRPHDSLKKLSPIQFESKYAASGSSSFNDFFRNNRFISKPQNGKNSLNNEGNKNDINFKTQVKKTVNVF